MKVLIIDDAVDLNNVIQKILQNHNFEVDCAYDGQSGLRKALENEYDIILLDIMLPQMNGYEVLKKFRSEGRTTPVIIITARDDINDKIEGLELGADDYLQKPFNMNELTARIKALARRSNISDFESDTIRYADTTLILSTRKLAKDDWQVTLSQSECEIMKYLINHSEVIVSEEKLITKCGLNPNDINKLLESVERIQKILKYIGSKIKVIFIKGVGYKLCY